MTGGRRALVTGAGSGIGAACVDRLLAQGCRVAALDLRAGDMADRADELDAIHEVDVTDPAAVRAIDGIDQMDIVLDYMLSKIPMGRLGLPEEVAALVGWLCSEDCSFSTGACYDISGGRATY